MGKEADLDTITVDQLHIFCYITSMWDADLCFKMLQMADLTIPQIEMVTSLHELAECQSKGFLNAPMVASIHRAKQRKNDVSHQGATTART